MPSDHACVNGRFTKKPIFYRRPPLGFWLPNIPCLNNSRATNQNSPNFLLYIRWGVISWVTCNSYGSNHVDRAFKIYVKIIIALKCLSYGTTKIQTSTNRHATWSGWILKAKRLCNETICAWNDSNQSSLTLRSFQLSLPKIKGGDKLCVVQILNTACGMPMFWTSVKSW